jgi:hypothetical protein
MIVKLHQPVFTTSDLLALAGLLEVCRRRQHTVLVVPSTSMQDVLATLPERLRDGVEALLRAGRNRYPALAADSLSIDVIHAEESDWTRARLTLADAFELLSSPLRLLIEDGRSDLAFLRRIVPSNFRRQLDEALDDRRAEVHHAGGLGQVKVILQDLCSSDATLIQRIRRLRTWVMFDRDAGQDAREPSAVSLAVKGLCDRPHEDRGDPWPLIGHQLGRRHAESYLPKAALWLWAEDGKGNERRRRQEKVTALEQLRSKRPQAAWQVDIKKGLRANLKKQHRVHLSDNFQRLKTTRPSQLAQEFPADALDSLFHDLEEFQRGALAYGFGDVAHLYGDANILDHVFAEEYDRGPTEQVSRLQLLESILQRL